jgi:hypothetical protein
MFSHSYFSLRVTNTKKTETSVSKKTLLIHFQNNLSEVKTKKSSTLNTKMFTLLKSTPKLLGAKVKIKFLYFDINKSEIRTTVYNQAVIERISPRTEIKRFDITLSQCVIGAKRIPGVQHHSHVVAVEGLRVIEEGHSDVNWEPEPTKTSRQELLEHLRTLSKSHKQNQSPSDEDDDDDWEIPAATPMKQRLPARLEDVTYDPSLSPPSPLTERRYSYRVAQLESARPKVVAPTHTTRSDLSPLSSSPEEQRYSQRLAKLAGALPKVITSTPAM